MALFERRCLYDEARGPWWRFVDVVVKSVGVSLLRRHAAEKRGSGRYPTSLDNPHSPVFDRIIGRGPDTTDLALDLATFANDQPLEQRLQLVALMNVAGDPRTSSTTSA